VVVDSSRTFDRGTADLVVFGIRFNLADGPVQARNHYVSGVETPVPDRFIRQVGLDATGGECHRALIIAVDRSPLSTVTGLAGLVLALLGGVGLVLAGRSSASLLRRCLIAVPLGLLAGIGVGILLYETAVVSPFSRAGWWPVLAGPVIAVGIALTRRQRIDTPAPPTADPATTEQAVEPVDKSRAGRTSTAALVLIAVAVPLAVVFTARTPAQAESHEVITPQAARLVFDSLWADARAGQRERLTGAAEVFADGILENMKGFSTNEVTDRTVGVPANQTQLPAYFVATAATAVEQDDMTLHFYAMIVKESADKPWTMAEFRVAPDPKYVPTPAILADGHLGPLPAVAELAVTPADLPRRYADWFNRSMDDGAIADDDMLSFKSEDTGTMHQVVKLNGVSSGRLPVFREYSANPATVRPELVPLADGSVLASFTTTAHSEHYNSNQPKTRSCTIEWLHLNDDDPTHYRHTRYDATIYSVAYIPTRTAKTKTLIHDNVIDDWTGTGDPC
jgi:hypothetical protein